MTPTILYRYEDGDFYQSEFPPEEWIKGRPRLIEFRVLRSTPCGVWIALPMYSKHKGRWNPEKHCREKWIGLGSRRAFAYPTKEEAAQSYFMRKWHENYHVEYRAKRNRHFLEEARELPGNDQFKNWGHG